MRIPEIRPYVIDNLKFMFKPDSIAVIGASRNPKKIGYQCLKNLIDSGYKGKIFPISPYADELLGLKCYPSINNVEDDIDLALVVIPKKLTEQIVTECAEKRVKTIAMITSGFSEVDNKELENRVVEICRKNKIPLLGPNIVGVADTSVKCNASFCQSLPYPGHIAFISQSGALAIALVGWTLKFKIGLSSLASIGNKADVDFSELILYYAERDENTRCICMYIEGIDAGPEFIESCKRAYVKKPLVALKAGISQRGTVAAMSHTGSLAGSTKIYMAAFRQGGVIPAENLTEMFDRALALSLQPPMMGDLCIVITNGGGAGVSATDASEKYGIPLRDTPDDLKAKAKNYMPSFGSVKNPIDLTGMCTKECYEKAITAALEHEDVDSVVVLYCHTAITDPMDIAEGIYSAVTKYEDVKKPVVACFIGGVECDEASNWLKEMGVPSYPSPERSMTAMGALREYGMLLGSVECDEASNWLKEMGVPPYPSPERSITAMRALRKYGMLLGGRKVE